MTEITTPTEIDDALIYAAGKARYELHRAIRLRDEAQTQEEKQRYQKQAYEAHLRFEDAKQKIRDARAQQMGLLNNLFKRVTRS